MLSEMNISSMLAVITLVLLIKPFLSREYNILDDQNIPSFFVGYMLALATLVSLFTYTFIAQNSEKTFLDLVGRSSASGMILLSLLYFIENRNDENLFEFLWERFSERRPQVFIWMGIVLMVPFVGIFTFQSELINGFCWFGGTIAGALFVELALELREFTFDGFNTEG